MVLSAKAGVPVGLEVSERHQIHMSSALGQHSVGTEQNLGATCYMNSYLQVWFQNDTFRDAVFRCSTDPRESIAKQPLYHLQVIFAALQRGLAASFNPVALVQCLQLNAGEQQDSQECAGPLFSKYNSLIAAQIRQAIHGGARPAFQETDERRPEKSYSNMF